MKLSDAGKFKVNGRVRFFDRLSQFQKIGPGKYIVNHHGVEYRIEGGRNAGGTAREWFVESSEWAKPICCTSVMDALKMLETM